MINDQALKKLCILIVRLYQILLSPLFPPSCRFAPSCSEYCVQAIRKHGVSRGLGYAILRILKCHPFHPGGYDPIR